MNALEMARKMETDAIEFYTEAASKTNYPAGKKMFETIVGDEKRHLEMISQIIKGLNVTAGDVSPIARVKTVFEQMKEEMMKKVEATTDDLEALKIAMKMEQEGAEFYKKSLAEAKTDKEKALFKRLIEEENQHYKIFSNSHQYLSDTGNWFMWQEHSIAEM
ncbi:MAG: ferritin family protein [Thermodesulfobacteriota bacterium]|nr:ferritin family protein [Thermodesulfobacteriota bacterium]